MNDLGKGHIGAVYGPLGTVHLKVHTPQIRDFLRTVMADLFPEPMVELAGPPCIDMSVRRKGDRLLIHLANTAGMQVASAYTILDYVPPVGPLTLRIRMEAPPAAVSQVPAGAVKHAWQDGVLTVQLRTLEIHTVVVIE